MSKTKIKRVCVSAPVLGGKARVFGSLRECCRELGLSEGVVRRSMTKGRDYRGRDWVVYWQEVGVPVRNAEGNAGNLIIKSKTRKI